MRIFFSILFFACACVTMMAQTPYDSFAPETSRPILELESSLSPKTILCVAVIDTSYTDDIRKWMSVDPLADKYPNISPYAYCGWNPINTIDPDGRDWYEAEDGSIAWTKYGSQEEMSKNGIIGTYLGKAVLDFKGSFYETLGGKDSDMAGYDRNFGNWGYIDGIGAITADVTMYGPNGENDITRDMIGFTMSSDYSTFGAIENGKYTATFVSPGKSGKLKSNWILAGNVEEYNGQLNVSPQAGKNYGTPYKNGIYIHSTNQSGYAGITAWSSEGSPYNAISTGCLLLAPRDFRTMNKTMSGLKSFIVRVVR